MKTMERKTQEAVREVRVRLECKACARVYEFAASPEDAARLSEACPDCGGKAARGLPAFEKRSTGTYRYVRGLERMAKVSDRAALRASAGEAPMAGSSGGGCCGGGGCGC